MSVDYNNIDNYIYDWVVAYTPVTDVKIWNFGNGVKPDLPFVSMQKLTSAFIGTAYQTPPSATGFIALIQPVELAVRFQAFGSNAMGRLDAIKVLGDHPTARDTLAANGMALVDTLLPTTDATGLLDEKYEERAVTDLVFRFTVTHGEDETIESGIIEKVDIDATYNVCGEERNSDIFIDSTI